ncbi:MAG: Holliday junction branch migration protein RuvA [Prochloraceae cyanobacterium]|nr:Holliday junction branch migration protein RuvA [Prochloraceae cyanobacterium]
MINYLKGKPVEVINNSNNRITLILEVNQIGYEIQIPSRLARNLPEEDSQLKIFTHLQIKEDQQILYGFASAAERDIFRQSIAVSGIGAQLAIALIDTLGLSDLVQAIVTGDVNRLTKTPGVGRKTAERVVLELKTKLAQWREIAGVTTSTSSAIPAAEILEDLEMTLLALGYTQEEIEQAVSILSKDDLMLKNLNVEDWIREAIAWLSQE